MSRFLLIAISLATAVLFAAPRMIDIYEQRFQQVQIRQMSQELDVRPEPIEMPTDGVVAPIIIDDDDDDGNEGAGTGEAADEADVVLADIEPMLNASSMERLVTAEAIVREQAADPQSKGAAYLELGSRYVEDGEHEKAEISFERALENLQTLPESPEVRDQKAEIYVERAKVHRAEGNEDAGRADLRQACTLQPSIDSECDDIDQ
ncbi:MAG: hypothetical protein GFH27_549285n204 [Chloroflexi bacterium AL-W]|nr:hypothetical protein [Chloroflexi bacterium AL-N1]NOK65716.1 hypothetical protein [Chloroflexi bacterium AL-N10]NOK74343.1 hypothetical protein [Chloroflexi bacterium AL-N5]NOK80749.1 hypothetical protein [Chloroflexi bacterium AL-W]NOK88601.1 hypothetical protein [Chloroflexi bacterium AL-N15]